MKKIPKRLDPEQLTKYRRERVKHEDAFAAKIVENGLPTFRRNARFHPIRRWKADFLSDEWKIIVEIEGGIWQRGGGRHNRGSGFVADCEKYIMAQLQGFIVLSMPSDWIYSGDAIKYLIITLRHRGWRE